MLERMAVGPRITSLLQTLVSPSLQLQIICFLRQNYTPKPNLFKSLLTCSKKPPEASQNPNEVSASPLNLIGHDQWPME